MACRTSLANTSRAMKAATHCALVCVSRTAFNAASISPATASRLAAVAMRGSLCHAGRPITSLMAANIASLIAASAMWPSAVA
ncbi:hypothetical protein D9M68_724340 [compost metagenome]